MHSCLGTSNTNNIAPWDHGADTIGLIESLIEDWYVSRYERQKRLQSIVGVADQKKSAKSAEKI